MSNGWDTRWGRFPGVHTENSGAPRQLVVGVVGIYSHWLNVSGKDNGFSKWSPGTKKAWDRNGSLNTAQLPGYLGSSEIRDKDGLQRGSAGEKKGTCLRGL